ncbi:MAG TPA: hypothetical protein VK712_03190 [Verrucomicrobiae bacterium]|jgi:hypothetical protein|nr:hypothetical protein [Verrucomicrobiae bacterium]
MRKRNGVQLNCFSPPVMVATMVTETALATYTVWRYKMTPTVRLATVTLLMLASFQLAEFFVCTGSVGHAIAWSRIGFAAITVLPPLGLHLMHSVAGKPGRRLVATAYASMAAFIIFFLAYPDVFANYQCTGNYVVFHLRPHAGGLYWLYYMGWIFTSMFLGVQWANEFKRRGEASKLKVVQALIIGWLVFLVPTAAANIVSPSTRSGIPSVMCGFAVLFALILALYILPRVGEENRLASLRIRLK